MLLLVPQLVQSIHLNRYCDRVIAKFQTELIESDNFGITIRYGDGIGLYRTHLFGSPAIISCFPATNRFILQSNESFILQWPTVDIVGPKALSTLQGKSHARLKAVISNAVNRPDALRRIAGLVQPAIIQALNRWEQRGRIIAFHETRKVERNMILR